MALDPVLRRRWLGGVVLVTALGMLVAGQTVLDGKLAGVNFVLYWLVCMGLTALAIVVALFDARAMARRGLREQRDLFESTLRDVQSQSQRDRTRKRLKDGT